MNLTTTVAFVSTKRMFVRHTSMNTPLGMVPISDDTSDEYDPFLNDIEAARIRYERLIGPLMFPATEAPVAESYDDAVVPTTASSSAETKESASTWSLLSFTTRSSRAKQSNNNINNLEQYEQPKGTSYTLLTGKDSNSRRPLLTNTARKRRLLEIQLLQSLVDTDDAIDELMSLWMYGECPSDVSAQTELALMENSKVSSSLTTNEVEQTLRTIIYNTHCLWVEPMNRLALLLFLKGKYDECQELITAVLNEKPWHFEALHLQLLLALVMTKTNGNCARTTGTIQRSALYWARKGLPPLHHTKRRAIWISNAIEQAKGMLAHLEDDSYQIRHYNNCCNEYDQAHNNDDDQVFPPSSSSIWQ